MNIIQDFIPAGRRNRPGRVNLNKFITVHNTGNANSGSNARAHANYIKSDTAANLPVSWHYTVDDTGAYQHLPDSEDAFHAGDGSGNGNRHSIGIEICMNSDGDLLKATDNAARLTAILCEKYNIALTNIVQHNNWSGKNCPQLLRAGRPYSWAAFINKVREFMSVQAEPVSPAPPPVSGALKSGDIIRLKADAKIYATGQAIPDWVKSRDHTVMQISGERVLLREIFSWVFAKDLQGI